MAFSKMVGLEVTPRRSSSSIFFRRSPVVSIARRMLSYQIDWPSFMISTRRLLINFLLEAGVKQRSSVSNRSLTGGARGHTSAAAAPGLDARQSLSNDAVRGGGILSHDF